MLLIQTSLLSLGAAAAWLMLQDRASSIRSKFKTNTTFPLSAGFHRIIQKIGETPPLLQYWKELKSRKICVVLSTSECSGVLPEYSGSIREYSGALPEHSGSIREYRVSPHILD